MTIKVWLAIALCNKLSSRNKSQAMAGHPNITAPPKIKYKTEVMLSIWHLEEQENRICWSLSNSISNYTRSTVLWPICPMEMKRFYLSNTQTPKD